MAIYRTTIADKATFAAGKINLGQKYHHLRLRHVAGADEIWVALTMTATASVKLSPPGGTPFPSEIVMDSNEGFEVVQAAVQGGHIATLEVVAWI